jgi:hypothetical protein
MAIDKKAAAALAAVTQYIQSEEEMVAAQAMADRQAAQPPAAGAVSVNLWGLNGRQAMMQMRNLMQLRAFTGARFR